ncbi:MAG: hypothetical protein QOD55_50 [Solirubrobacteraceae bacterium]|nr:hypothetical protein [Solirubrobacteraceae bacterium]
MIARPRDRDLDAPELEDLVTRLAGRPDLWAHLVRHDPGERVYEEVLRDNHVAVWLICWMEDHDTGFHDHDLSSGAVAVLAGGVREERLVLAGPPAGRSFGPGGSFTFGPADIHRVLHEGDQPAVTIHAYSPPLRGMGVYQVDEQGTLQRRPTPSSEELRAGAAATA